MQAERNDMRDRAAQADAQAKAAERAIVGQTGDQPGSPAIGTIGPEVKLGHKRMDKISPGLTV